MTNLKCNAKNCMHNESPYCCISHICVGGINAKTESETCCDNFQERRENAVNSCRSHEKNPSVDSVTVSTMKITAVRPKRSVFPGQVPVFVTRHAVQPLKPDKTAG